MKYATLSMMNNATAHYLAVANYTQTSGEHYQKEFYTLIVEKHVITYYRLCHNATD